MDREPHDFNPRFLWMIFIFSLIVTSWILVNIFLFSSYLSDQTASVSSSTNTITVNSSIITLNSTKVYIEALDNKSSIGKQKKGSVGVVLEGPIDKFYKVDFKEGTDGYVKTKHISYYNDPTRDTIPPVVTILSPRSGVSVNAFIFEVNATDNVAVSKVEFMIDKIVVATLTEAPYRIYLGTGGISISNGAHTFGTRVSDASGNITTIDPEVIITSPTIVRDPDGSVYIRFTFAGVAGNSYDIQKTTSLTSPITWTTVSTIVANTDGIIPYLAPAVGQAGFFRIITISPPPSHILTVSKMGTGQGTINSITPDGRINCNNTCPSTSASFTENSSVTLRALANTNSIFNGWSGACLGIGDCVVLMNSARSVTANFTTIPIDPRQRYPWQNFDLSKWKIQVTAKPTPPTEYFPSDFTANASAFSTWFRTDPTDGSMLFWLDSFKSPASGTYLRSELREVIDGSTSYTNWNPLIGTHTLRANIKVKQISGMPSQITVLQIHPYDPIKPLLRVAWYLNSSNPSQSYIKAHYKTDATGNANASVTCSNPVGLNPFDAEVIVQNQQLIVNINNIRCLTYNIPFWSHEGYFKAGDYAQAYAGTSQINFYRLEAIHTP